MASNVAVPALGESITEAVVSQWLKQDGDHVELDEPICELESDKATVDLPAPASGILRPQKPAGETARVGEVIAQIEDAPAAAPNAPPSPRTAATSASKPGEPTETKPAPAKQPPPQPHPQVPAQSEQPAAPPQQKPRPAPAVASERPSEQAQAANRAAPTSQALSPKPQARPASDGTRREPMSKIRRSIAERLVRAQQTAAMLTTFNEIDMTAVQELRARHGAQFKETHGVSLGLMSFFARASVLALKQFPAVNAMLDGSDVVYHDYVNLGIAVGTERGLVVPVLRNVESMSFARIEQEIKRAAMGARDGKLSLSELSGGTFTITNGGVFGSLLSTPILNPPQTGILGMHAIQDRPVAINKQVEIRPMMYVALTYDHRLVDGQTSVSFLVRLKKLLEDPMQMILEI